MSAPGPTTSTELGSNDGPRSARAGGLGAWLDRQKDSMSTLQAVVTICAIFVGGTWTYLAFIQQRQSHPRLKIEYTVRHWKLSPQQTLLSVTENLTNTGPVLLRLRAGEIRVIQVLPLPSHIAHELPGILSQPIHAKAEASIYDPNMWDVLVDAQRHWREGDEVIEPGESDPVPNEFILPGDIQAVAIFSYIVNPDGKNLGWNGLAYYSFDSDATNTSLPAANAGKNTTQR